jgi:hypothetical protein
VGRDPRRCHVRGDVAGRRAFSKVMTQFGGVFYGEFPRVAIESVGELRGRDWELIMPTFSPALITIMRSVLEDAMTKVPAEQATTVTKAYLAEFILKAAAGGLTNYEGLITAALSQLPVILSKFM